MRKPSFLLKPSAYKASKLYAILPDNGNGDGVVSGGDADATRVNKNGFIEQNTINFPRIDYHNGAGLLLEPTRENQFTQSQTVTGQFTATTVTVTDNDAYAPDSTKTAAKIADSAEGTAGSINKSVTVLSSTVLHAISFFVKFGDVADTTYEITTSVSGQTATISISEDGTTAVVSDTNSIITRVGSDRYKDGWFRFYCTVDMLDTDTSIDLKIYPCSSDVDREGYIWVWGFQLEAGDLRTSYIPTTSTSVIRSQETVTFSNLISNGLISDSANGSYFFDVCAESQITDSTGLGIYVGDSAQGISITTPGTTESRLVARVKNADATTNTHTMTTNRAKILFNLFGDNTEVWVNGSKVISTSKDMSLGADTMVWRSFIGSLKLFEAAIFNKALSDTESKSITQ